MSQVDLKSIQETTRKIHKFSQCISLLICLFGLAEIVHAQIALPNGGIVSTLAGNGSSGYSGDSGLATSALVNGPWGIAVDSSGNLYISDSANNVIRKVTGSTGIITTVAGTGSAGYSGDGGAATDAELNGPAGIAVDSGGNLYIADIFQQRCP